MRSVAWRPAVGGLWLFASVGCTHNHYYVTEPLPGEVIGEPGTVIVGQGLVHPLPTVVEGGVVVAREPRLDPGVVASDVPLESRIVAPTPMAAPSFEDERRSWPWRATNEPSMRTEIAGGRVVPEGTTRK